jgi:microcystin-dependent protein
MRFRAHFVAVLFVSTLALADCKGSSSERNGGGGGTTAQSGAGITGSTAGQLMKHGHFLTAIRAPAAGQLPMAMATSVLSARLMRLGRPLAHAIVVPPAQVSPWTTPKTSRALDALAVSATKASLFAHGRRGPFFPRTRGLAQHDV